MTNYGKNKQIAYGKKRQTNPARIVCHVIRAATDEPKTDSAFQPSRE